jgi:hypothetical protein
MPKIKEPKKPTVTADDITNEIGKLERKAIEAITYWVYSSPGRAITINPDLDIYITCPERYSNGRSAKIEQVLINEAGKVVVSTDYSDNQTLIDSGDFSANDIAAIYEAIEQTITVK